MRQLSPVEASVKARAERLRQFIAWFLPTVFGFSLLFIGLGLTLGRPGLLGSGLIVLAYACVLFFARRLNRRSYEQRAVSLIAYGMLVTALLIVPLQPALTPTLALIAFLAAAVALPFRVGPALTRLLVLCALASSVIIVVGLLLLAEKPANDATSLALSISSYGAATAFVSLLLWQFSTRLTEDLAQSEAANLALHEARSIEAQLQEAQKLESLGALAGGIAHDFNNLLAVIVGHAGLLRAPMGADEVAHSLDEIEAAAQRAATLTHQMLAYAGRGRINMGPVNLNDLVLKTLALAEVGRASSLVRCELTPDLPAVYGDQDQLGQMVLSLLLNALEAHAAPGTIRISTTLATSPTPPLALSRSFLEPQVRSMVQISVRDDGIGMTAEVLARAVDPFYTTKFTGRGLGLAAALGIVRSHRGALDAESTLGVGSHFRVLLPVMQPQPTGQRP